MPPSPDNSTALRRLQEANPGRDPRDVVTEVYNRHGALEGTAAELGISVPTLRSWITAWRGRYQIRRNQTLVFPPAEKAA